MRQVPGIVISFDTGSEVKSVRFEQLSEASSFSFADDTNLSFSATGSPVVNGNSRNVSREWMIVGYLPEAELRTLLEIWHLYRAEEAAGKIATVTVIDETFPHTMADPYVGAAVIDVPPGRPSPGRVGGYWIPASLTLKEV